jgi:hypothetical protein
MHRSQGALVPNNDWTIYVPTTPNKTDWKPLNERVNVDEDKCPTHPKGGAGSGSCAPAPPPTPAVPLPYEAVGSVDVGTGESSIFMFNGQRWVCATCTPAAHTCVREFIAIRVGGLVGGWTQ